MLNTFGLCQILHERTYGSFSLPMRFACSQTLIIELPIPRLPRFSLRLPRTISICRASEAAKLILTTCPRLKYWF